MRRREFISLLGGAATVWPLASQAQLRERVRRIGVLMHLAADDPDGQSRLAAFLQGVQEAGWIVGRNVAIDVRCTASAWHDAAHQIRRRHGSVAQLAEQRTFNPLVAGSIPARPISAAPNARPPADPTTSS